MNEQGIYPPGAFGWPATAPDPRAATHARRPKAISRGDAECLAAWVAEAAAALWMGGSAHDPMERLAQRAYELGRRARESEGTE